MGTEKRSYFAYGSNMNSAQMVTRCPGAEAVGAAHLMDYRFLINSRGVATVIAQGGSHVWGILWSISADNEKSLDRYEGVSLGYYRRATLDLDVPGGQKFHALAYLATDATSGHPRDGYLEKIVEAATLNEFPSEYLSELRSWVKTS